MRYATRVLTALVAVVLVLSAPSAGAAPGGSDPVARQQRQLLHALDKVSDALDRSVKASRVGVLSDTTEAALRANVAADQAELAAVRAAVPTLTDLRQARKDLKDYRAVNYVLVVNVLRKAERLLADATGNTAATTALTAVIDEALDVDANTTEKPALRDLRADLKAAKDLLEPAGTTTP